jgi:hypothetical protein
MVQWHRALLVFLAGFPLASAQEDANVSATDASMGQDPCLEQDYATKNYDTCCTHDGYKIEAFGPAKAGRGPVCKIVEGLRGNRANPYLVSPEL